MKKSAALPAPVDVATFERLLAAGRVCPVRLPGRSGLAGAPHPATAVSFGVDEMPAPAFWSIKQWAGEPIIRFAHDWPVGLASGPERSNGSISTGPVRFLGREVSEAAWAVGQLYGAGLLTGCSINLLPARWERGESGELLITEAELLDVSAVPNFVPGGVDRARELGIPLGWLKEWVDQVLAQAATSEEARLRLVCHPDQLQELERALVSPMVQVPGDDDLLVAKVDQLITAVERLTVAVDRLTTATTLQPRSLVQIIDAVTSGTPPPAPGA